MFYVPTDVMESGMSSTFCPHSASLVKTEMHPWGVGGFEHFPSGDGFTQLRMCVPGLSSPRTPLSLLQTPVGHLTRILFSSNMLSSRDNLVRYLRDASGPTEEDKHCSGVIWPAERLGEGGSCPVDGNTAIYSAAGWEA